MNLYINEKKMLIILKCDECDTLSLYIDDFLTRYKPHDMNIESKEDLMKFLRHTLPKVTHV